MIWADWFILGVIAISTVLGAFRGFVREAFSLAAWVAALIVARVFSHAFATFLVPYIDTPSLRTGTAFVLLFVSTLVLCSVVAYLVQTVVKAAGLGWYDRMLGTVFGVLRGLIIVLVVLMVIAPYVSRDTWWHKSRLAPVFMKYEFLGRELKDEVQDFTLPAGKK